MEKRHVILTVDAHLYCDDDDDMEEILKSTFAFPLAHLIDNKLLGVQILEKTSGKKEPQEEATPETKKATSTIERLQTLAAQYRKTRS